MKSFKRISKYIWPQWPRVVVVVLCAILATSLLAVSFMTVIPLLNVMMNKEGLHGWVDRKACDWLYGIDFYVPGAGDSDDYGSLLVTNVKKGGIAKKAGLENSDRIVGVGKSPIGENVKQVTYARLLQELATTNESVITVEVKRLNNQGFLESRTIPLNSPKNRDYIEGLPLGILGRFKLAAKTAVIERAEAAISILPREQGGAGQTKAIIFIIVGVGIVTVIRCVAKFYQSYIAEKVVQIGINHLRRDAFIHVMNMPMKHFADEKPSDAVSRLVRDTGAMGNGIKIMLGKALLEPMTVLFLLAGAAWLNWQLTLIFLCGGPPTVYCAALLGKRMKKASKKSLMAWSQMLAKLQETMAGLKVVKVYNQQKYESDTFEVINQRLLKQSLKISKVDAATRPVLEVLGMAAGSVALIFGASWVARKQLESAEFLGLLILLGSAAEAVRKTSDIWNKIQEADAASERVFTMMDEPLEDEKSGAIDISPLKDKIEFKDIVFTYPGTERPVLNHVSLTVKAGSNVAIVGPNGSGKTTLANLLPRFYDPDSGCIRIDGRDIRDVTLFSLRNQIAMVTQNVVTFNDTVAANIAYGKSGAGREEIITASKRAFAHEFIEQMTDGYDAIIGEQGAGLSGGQLQRIIIARAILKNPAILIFDEATSQVDADSEAKIHNAIEEITKNRTTFIIAHRFSTIINADVIVVMDDGRIIAQGQHEELIKSCRLYQSLYETQLIAADK
jgi:subfamily B ATP-binding cassette protein MsbA